jgi:hypothetical protein
MKLRMIIETYANHLAALVHKHGMSAEEVRSICRKVGKTRWIWVLHQWFQGKISLPEDQESVTRVLSNFEAVKRSLPIDKREISKYQSLKEVEEIVNPLVGIVSSKKKHEFEGLKGVKVVNKNGPYVTVMVTDPESLGALGEGTKWCTKSSYLGTRKEYYIYKYGHIFMILRGGKPVMQYAPNYEEIRDIYNDPVIDKNKLSIIPKPELKEGNAEALYAYALNVMGEEWPEAEPYIAKDAKWAYYYARDVMRLGFGVLEKDRWYEAERYIIKNPKWACSYAIDVMKGKRWPDAEPYIMQDPESAYYYARDVIEERWSEAEPYIMKDPEWAYWYAYSFMRKKGPTTSKGRWPEAEEYIMRSPQWAYKYARDMIGDRWPEAEDNISKDQEWATEYSNFLESMNKGAL